ncbi:Frataxin [Flammula alnicola]|nr:Frataxin [Flammula alnicola]
MEQYHTLADKTMEDLLGTLEELLDSEEDTGYEVDYHSGVLTLNLGSHGTYVINKQPPNKQIWLSSPLSGPQRYDYNEETGEWFYSRDGRTFDGLLSEELSNIFAQPIKIRV